MFDIHSLPTIIPGILAVVSYGFFSKNYEPRVRKSPNSLYSAAILYGWAAVMLTAASIATAFIFGPHFDLPQTVTVFGLHFLKHMDVVGVFFIMILCMSLLYYKSIEQEAQCRKSMNMGAYTVLFQLNIIVITVIDFLAYHIIPHALTLVGGLLIFASSISILIVHYLHSKHNGNKDFSRRLVSLGLLAALCCGAALYFDGEMSRNYIFKGNFKAMYLSFFIFYEMITFGIPSFWCTVHLSLQNGINKTIKGLKREFLENRKGYLLASFFSATNFVFSVLALALPGPRFIVAMILAMSPIFTIFLDRNERASHIIKLEYTVGAVGVIGLFLMSLG
ncbi:MAG TPA: hypothetical protein VEW42_03020 [Candidatus Eisenbacteria bacterium]|nr:hypothetical protein [Candidatus Eisenbacteria bacterium]